MILAQTNVIDISKWQKASDLDWQGLVDNGVKAVIIQLSHGLEYEDQAKESIAKAKQYGLIWHGYHFYEGLSGEVSFSTSNAKSLGLPDNAYMFLDMEGSIGGDWQSQFYDFRTAWLSAGWRTGIYTSDSPYRAKFNNAKLVKDSVYRWIASYGKNNGSPDLSYEPADYDMWQYTSSGGIGQYVSDLDHNYDKTGSLILTYEQNVKGSVGFSKDSIRGGGVGLGYSPDQKSFRVVLSPNGFEFNQDDGDRIWPFISGKIPKPTDVSNFITADYVLSQLKAYAKLTDIPDVSKFLTESNLASYALKTDIPSLDGYAKLTDIPKVDLSNYATKDDLAKVQTIKGDTGPAGKDGTSGNPFLGALNGNVTVDDKHTQGTYYLAGASITDSLPDGLGNSCYALLEVETMNGATSDNTIIQTIKAFGGNIYVRSNLGLPASWSAWKQLATKDDSAVDETKFVHISTDETITGKKTFSQAPLVTGSANAVHAILQANMGQGSKNPIIMASGTENSGDMVGISAGGTTLVGSGESTPNLVNDILSKKVPSKIANYFGTPQDEVVGMLSDSNAFVITNFQNNNNDLKAFLFGSNGDLTIEGQVIDHIKDTRKTNQNPAWYIKTYPQGVVREFKNMVNIGIVVGDLPTGYSLGFCELETHVPWPDATGGYPTQIARSTQTARPVTLSRIGTSDSTWSAWELMTTW